MANKISKGKEPGSRPSSVASKLSSDSKSKPTSSTSPHSSKTTKGKLGFAEKQKLEEENFAREQERVRRETPDEFGVSLNDYLELLSCPLEQLSDTCSRTFGYSTSNETHKNALLHHLYVRTMHDLRQFAGEEKTLKRLSDIFLGLLNVFSKEFLDMFEAVDVMGTGYAFLLQPPTVLSNEVIEQIMTFFVETYIVNFNLYRYALTTDVSPIYKVWKVTIRSPNSDAFSNTALCPLAEAVPQKEVKCPFPTTKPAELQLQVSPHNMVTELLSQAGEMAKSDMTVADHQMADLSEADVQQVVERVAISKFGAFQREVEEVIKKRQAIVAAKFPR